MDQISTSAANRKPTEVGRLARLHRHEAAQPNLIVISVFVQTRIVFCVRAFSRSPAAERGLAIAIWSVSRACYPTERLDQLKAARRNAVLEQPLSFAEHQRKDPDVIFVDEFGGDQRLQQFTAALDMQRRPIRRLQPADFIHDITAYVLRVLPVERT